VNLNSPMNRALDKWPRLCFVGPMVGKTAGYVTTQGLILSQCFAAAEYSVISVSQRLSRCMRLLDIVRTLFARRREIDVQCLEVYSGRSFILQDVASLLGRILGQRIVMVLHGGSLPEFMARNRSWTKRVLSRADLLVAPSNFMAKAAAENGFEARVIPNVLDLSLYPFRHRRGISPKILWMRSFHPTWNPAMAIRAVSRLRDRGIQAELVMAGQDKGFEAETRSLAQRLGVANAVRFPGFLTMADKIRVANEVDIFITTNRIDNMPVAVLEACAVGLPVVATAVGGIPDFLTEGETGLLVPDDDDEMMASAIERLINDPCLAARLSTNGRALAERSSWPQVRQAWEQLFRELLPV
jgi:glycosyltransferase involved in cell wall biosynthesis